MAPPRLRIRLNSPLASGRRLASTWPSASRVGGNRQNMMATPRMTCGQNITSKSVCGVCSPLSPRPRANKPEAHPGQLPRIEAFLSATAIGGEGQHEPVASAFQHVADHHGRDGEHPKSVRLSICRRTAGRFRRCLLFGDVVVKAVIFDFPPALDEP